MDLWRWLRNQWDRVAAAVLGVTGLIALLFGWLGVSRVTLPGEQIPYLASGAVLGLWTLGAAATLWLSADLRDIWRRLGDLEKQREASEEDSLREQPDRSEPAPRGGARAPFLAR